MLKLRSCFQMTISRASQPKRYFSDTKGLWRGVPWTEAETEKLKDMLQQQKTAWEIASHFTDRSTSSVTVKASKLRKMMTGVRLCKYAHWTDAEKGILREAESKGSDSKSLQALLPGRSYNATRSYRKNMRGAAAATRGHLKISEHEIADIARMRDDEKLTWSEIGNRTGRTLSAVVRCYQNRVKWSISKGPRIRPWPEEEVATLKSMLAVGATQKEIAKQMGRSVPSIKNQVISLTRLEGRRWSKNVPFSRDEDQLLVQGTLAGKRPRDLCDLLPSRSESAIRGRLKRLEDQPQPGDQSSNDRKDRRTWTADQEARLFQARKDGVSWHSLAIELGRSVGSIQNKYARLRQSIHLRKDEDSGTNVLPKS